MPEMKMGMPQKQRPTNAQDDQEKLESPFKPEIGLRQGVTMEQALAAQKEYKEKTVLWKQRHDLWWKAYDTRLQTPFGEKQQELRAVEDETQKLEQEYYHGEFVPAQLRFYALFDTGQTTEQAPQHGSTAESLREELDRLKNSQ